MRRTVLLLASTALTLLLACGMALAEDKLDQENAGPWASPSHYQEFNSDRQHLAQSFTARKTGPVSKISVWIQKSYCGPGSWDTVYKDIRVRIGVTSTTLPASQVPYRDCTSWWAVPWTEVTFDPGNRPYVIAGQEYRLYLEPEPVSYTSPSYHWFYNGDYLPGGVGNQRYVDTPGYPWTPYGALVVTGDRRALHNAFSTPALPASREGESMKVSYYPDTDSLFVKLKPGLEAEGSEVAPGIVFHYTAEGEVTAIDIDSKASKLVDLSLLEVEGLPISATQRSPQKAGLYGLPI